MLHRRKGEAGVHERPDLFTALGEVGHRLEPIFCGGQRRTNQEREQWASGCNLLTLRPGVALAYARNEKTLCELERAGFLILDAEGFLVGERELPEGGRAIITLEGSELVRGGGGPRCMTLPLRRDAA